MDNNIYLGPRNEVRKKKERAATNRRIRMTCSAVETLGHAVRRTSFSNNPEENI